MWMSMPGAGMNLYDFRMAIAESIPPSIVWHIVSQIADALTFLLAASKFGRSTHVHLRVAHGNLHLGNVMLRACQYTGVMQVKLIDFGLARHEQSVPDHVSLEVSDRQMRKDNLDFEKIFSLPGEAPLANVNARKAPLQVIWVRMMMLSSSIS